MIEVYNNYPSLGINSRIVTEGEEYDMVRDFIDYKKWSFRSSSRKDLAVFIETKINDAYPDIIFAEYNPLHYEHWNSNRDKLTMTDLKVLHFLYSKKNVTSQRLVRELSISYKSVLFSLEMLVDAQLVERKNGFWHIPNKQEAFGVTRIEAVEAKISKWNTVMQQAIINTSFASESFVLSKRKKLPDDETVQKVKSFGIGIYLYDDCTFSCIAPASHKRFPSNYNSIYLNECIGRILNH